MQSFLILVAVLALAGCSTTADTQTDIQTAKSTQSSLTTLQKPAVATAMEFLLTSAATDFHAHPPVEAILLHNVRLGHVLLSDGAEQYMLCGELSSAKNSSNAERTSFATIKTSGYEQWIGAQAVGLCKRDSIIWDSNSDLSSLLQSRVDSISVP